jgi:hypothetical protein
VVTRSRRLLGVLTLVATSLLIMVAPAAAHVRVSEATGFDSVLTHVPEVDGVGWELFAGGELIAVTNAGPHAVTVLGYEGEPFLRAGPDGVAENRNSPAAYLNEERFADVAVPPRADPDASPDWRLVNDPGRHTWHDHRTHWMSPELPPVVARDPAQRHLVLRWEVPLLVDGEPDFLRGELWWEPFPQRTWWWSGAFLLAGLTGLAALRLPRAGRGLRAAGQLLAVVAAANTVHLVDEVAARPAPTLDVLSGLLHTGLFVGAGLFAAWWVQRPRDGRRLVLGIGAAGIAFHQGLLQLPALTASGFDTLWPPWLIRSVIVAGLAQAVGAAVVILRTRAIDVPGERGAGRDDPTSGRTMEILPGRRSPPMRGLRTSEAGDPALKDGRRRP